MAHYFDRRLNGRHHQALDEDSLTAVVPVSPVAPIAVWRLDDRDCGRADDESETHAGAGFEWRLARRLILVYTDHGDTLVDFDNDPYVRDAAHRTGRVHVPITAAADVADLDALSGPVTLAVVRWPRPEHSVGAAAVGDLFKACRLMLTGAGCVIAAIRPVPAGDTFADEEPALRRGADAAGMARVLRIVATCGSGGGDQFLYYATDRDAVSAAGEHAATSRAAQVDLLVFTGGPP